MPITKIKVSNFKSFDELEVDLRPLNVVVGGNASGKSNFLEIFRFLRDLGRHGLEDAISLQGGMEYLTNLRIGSAQPMSLDISVKYPGTVSVSTIGRKRYRFSEATYGLSLRVSDGAGYEVLREVVFAGQRRMELDASHLFSWSHELSLFDFDPKLVKRGTPVAARARLEPDGSNLAVVLKSLLRREGDRAKFTRLLQDLLPFVEDLKVGWFANRSLMMSLKESFAGEAYIPASSLSDGTVQMAALIVALYFERSDVTVLEEPDRNIHPHLISRLAEMMRDASTGKQVIATTHNPELVKHTALEDLLLVRRDEHGFSRISRPAESEELKVFLANDLGVEDLYVQNLLDIGHGV